jgi:hypothetical protein
MTHWLDSKNVLAYRPRLRLRLQSNPTAPKKNAEPPSALDKFQIIVAIFVSITTAFIGFKTFQLNEQAGLNNERLKSIEASLSERRFDFEQFKDIYDRTEKYLSSEQDEKRGRALVVLVSAIPESQFRADLLSMLTVQAEQGAVSTAAAEKYVGNSLPLPDERSRFVGTLQMQTLQDGRMYTTLAEISFVDSMGKTWTVPRGARLTGASIPAVAWSVLGSPFEGKSRVPAVFHEYYVITRTRSSSEVNRMFYEALLASGVDQLQAKVLYVAVQNFGPRFSGPATDRAASSPTPGDNVAR